LGTISLFPREQRGERTISRVRSSAKRFAATKNPEEITMFRKTIITTLTVALIAGSTITAPTTASAANGRGILGVAAALVAGAVVASAVNSARAEDGYRYDHRGSDCFEKPMVRYDGYTGRSVVVGYKTICR
jgi:hypothetical protein